MGALPRGRFRLPTPVAVLHLSLVEDSACVSSRYEHQVC